MPDRLRDPRAARFDEPAEVAADAARRLNGRHLVLLTDFDGTLAELVLRPSDAVLSDRVRGAFCALATAPRTTLGVVSGRRRRDVAARVGGVAAYAAGLHGLEITGPDGEFRHRALDEVGPVIEKLANEAVRRLAWCDGCLVEDKRFALTCHVRQVADSASGQRALEEFEALVEPYLEARILRLLTGSKAMEVLPAVDWHKGRAVDWIRARVETRVSDPIVVLYLGDDRTDEDAFTALRDDDVAIGVGERPHTHMIDARLEGPAAVGRFFAVLGSAIRSAG